MEVTLILIVVVVGFLLFNRWRKESATNGSKNLPPGPLCLPWIGSAYAMGSSTTHIHVTIHKLAEKWGPIFRLKVGPTQLIVITDPTIIRETFHGLDSPVLLRFISETFYQLDEGVSLVFAKTKPQWAMIRRLAHPIIRNLPNGTTLQTVIAEENSKLIAALDKQLNQEVYLNPMFMFFTRNVFFRITLNKAWSFDTLDAEEKEFSNAMIGIMDHLSNIADFIPALDFLATRSRTIMLAYNASIENYVRRELRKREKEERSEPRDLLDTLMVGMKDNPDFTEAALVHSWRNLLIAATLTVSDTLDWMILYLCVNPDMQDKCYNEIKDKLHDRTPTAEDQDELPYLDCVIKEAMRIRPTAPLSLPHVASQDCNIAGYHIDKGSLIMTNIYGIGNSERIFKNASQFDPDRFQRDPELASQLMSFGWGPTICLGMPIAKQELFLAAATLLQRYKFTIGPSTPSPDFTGEFKVAFNPKPWKTIASLRG